MAKNKFPGMEERDVLLLTAVQQFFTVGEGDMHEFKHMVREAINTLPVATLDINVRARHALIGNNITTLGQLRSFNDAELSRLAGVGMVLARHIASAFSTFNTNDLFKEDRRAAQPANYATAHA